MLYLCKTFRTPVAGRLERSTRGSKQVITANFLSLLRPRFATVRPGLALAALLILTASLGGCASFDPARISVNLAPVQGSSIGW